MAVKLPLEPLKAGLAWEWVDSLKLAVMRVEPLIPNVKLFEFEKTIVPLVPVWVPAAAAIPPPAPAAPKRVVPPAESSP